MYRYALLIISIFIYINIYIILYAEYTFIFLNQKLIVNVRHYAISAFPACMQLPLQAKNSWIRSMNIATLWACGWKVSSAQWRRDTQRNFIQNHRPQYLPNRKPIDLQSVSQSQQTSPKFFQTANFKQHFLCLLFMFLSSSSNRTISRFQKNKQQIRVRPVSSLLHRAELPQCQQILKLPWAN